ncbi:hypothetical protein EB061_10840, partial [bacterium]|nr:hypothetical protein [bacterium]
QLAETFEKLGLGRKDAMLRLLRSSSLIQAVGLGSEEISSLEGYLFPNTYFFDKRDTPENLIRRMVDGFLHTWTPEFEARAKEIGLSRKEDLRRKTPYNTYTIPGLPIGPISNPGRDAVRAVLYPADTDFLYFVSKNDGTHMFTKTYGDHSDWVKRLQIDPKAREGKSWRDLSKKQEAGKRTGSHSR